MFLCSHLLINVNAKPLYIYVYYYICLFWDLRSSGPITVELPRRLYLLIGEDSSGSHGSWPLASVSGFFCCSLPFPLDICQTSQIFYPCRINNKPITNENHLLKLFKDAVQRIAADKSQVRPFHSWLTPKSSLSPFTNKPFYIIK